MALPCGYWSPFLSSTLLNPVLMKYYFSRLCGHVCAAYPLPEGGSQDKNRAYLHWWRRLWSGGGHEWMRSWCKETLLLCSECPKVWQMCPSFTALTGQLPPRQPSAQIWLPAFWNLSSDTETNLFSLRNFSCLPAQPLRERIVWQCSERNRTRSGLQSTWELQGDFVSFCCLFVPFPWSLILSPNSEKTDPNCTDKNNPTLVSQHLSYQSLAKTFLLKQLVLSCHSELSRATNASQQLSEEFACDFCSSVWRENESLILMICDYSHKSIQWWLSPDHELWSGLMGLEAVICGGLSTVPWACLQASRWHFFSCPNHYLLLHKRREESSRKVHQSHSRDLHTGQEDVRLPVDGNEGLGKSKEVFLNSSL